MSAFDDSSAALSLLQLATEPSTSLSAAKCLFPSIGDSNDPVVLSDDDDSSLTSLSTSATSSSVTSNSSQLSPVSPPVSPSCASKSITDTNLSISNKPLDSSATEAITNEPQASSAVLSAASQLKVQALGMRRSLVPFNSKPFTTPRDVPVSTRPKRASAPFSSSASAPKRLGIGPLSLVSPSSVSSSVSSSVQPKPNSNNTNEGVLEECLSHVCAIKYSNLRLLCNENM